MVAARLRPLFEKEARARELAGKAIDPEASLPQGRTRELAAAVTHVSPRSVDAGSKVLEKGVPELSRAVESGQVSVSAAAVLTELPPDEQRDVVAGGKQAAVEKAKELRERKPNAARQPQEPDIE